MAPSEKSPAVRQPIDSASFADFALRYRQSQGRRTQRKELESRLYATKISLGISTRLARIGASVRKGLVECLKLDDKHDFIAIYQTFLDMVESSGSVWRPHHRQAYQPDPLVEWSSQPPPSDPGGFFVQLSQQSRGALVDILRLIRSDSQFLFERLRALSQSQLAGLVSSAAADASSSASATAATEPMSSSFRGGRSSFPMRHAATTTPVKDQVLRLERADPLSALLFNVFAAPLDSHSSDARLRLDVWSSVCAKLISYGGIQYYPLVSHILSSWANASEWKARPRFELYLMGILQAGAFLLEHVDTPAGLGEPPDPLRTDVAEEFFASAVNTLFRLLDERDAGFPHAVMELVRTILAKVERPDVRDRFLEYLLVQWFFTKFLYGALVYPEVCISPLPWR